MATSAVAREAVFALRKEIARIEGRLAETLDEPPAPGVEPEDRWVVRHQGRPDRLAVLQTGSGRLDAALGGGVPRAGLAEIHGAQTRDAGAVSGFALGLVAQLGAQASRPLLWIATSEILSEAGSPYAPGLACAYGIEPEALLLACAPKLDDALWVAEEAAALSSLAAVLLEVRGTSRKLDLTATRRLHRRALASGRPLLLLRQAGRPEPTAAPVRLIVAAAPAAERALPSGTLAGSIGPPAVSVTIGRSRTTITATATLEWDDHDRGFRERQPASVGAQDSVALVSPAAERTHPAPPLRPHLAKARRAGGIAA